MTAAWIFIVFLSVGVVLCLLFFCACWKTCQDNQLAIIKLQAIVKEKPQLLQPKLKKQLIKELREEMNEALAN